MGQLSLLVGGRNLWAWQRDAEIWGEEGKLDISIADFPFRLGSNNHLRSLVSNGLCPDTPYIWWSTEARAVVVCGGMNWDLDQSDAR